MEQFVTLATADKKQEFNLPLTIQTIETVFQLKDVYLTTPEGRVISDLNKLESGKLYRVVGEQKGSKTSDTSAKLEESVQAVLESQQRLEKRLLSVTKDIIKQKRARLDVWTPSKRSLTESISFKNALLEYYERREPPSNINCMVLGKPYAHDKVKASHIWKHATHGKDMDCFGLSADDLSNPRNGLLLAEPLELAFDSKQACFYFDPFSTQLKFVVLDPQLLANKKPIEPNGYGLLTWGDVDGKPLLYPKGKEPFKRLLSWHAYCSFKCAKALGWIDQTKYQLFKDYHKLSETALYPEDENDFELQSEVS